MCVFVCVCVCVSLCVCVCEREREREREKGYLCILLKRRVFKVDFSLFLLLWVTGKSLQMLEQYSGAEKAYLEGLHANLEHEKINQALKDLKQLLGDNIKPGNTESPGPAASGNIQYTRASSPCSCRTLAYPRVPILRFFIWCHRLSSSSANR